MSDITFINSMEEFLEYNQIIYLLSDQMEHIGSPKTNQEIMETFKLAFKNDAVRLLVLSKASHPVGFIFFNVSIGMESGGKYIWLNEMHIHREYRGQGFGSELFDYLKEWCKKEGILRIMGMVDTTDERTLEFYEKQGCETYPQTIFSIKCK